jgi:hypothetical protein
MTWLVTVFAPITASLRANVDHASPSLRGDEPARYTPSSVDAPPPIITSDAGQAASIVARSRGAIVRDTCVTV